jgi:cytochrome c
VPISQREEALMPSRMLSPLLLAGLLVAGGAQAQGDLANGKLQFRKCAICHAAEAGKNKIGPSLFGIVGRKSASEANFSYSDAMKKFDRSWDDATLDSYLVEPRKTVPGTKMIFAGLKDKKDRDDLIAYLGTLK